jgi:acyl carrier protein
MSLEQVTYHAISLENSMAYTMSTDVTTVGIYEIGFTQTNMFTSFLEIVPVYIYMLEFDNIAYTIASTLSLDKVEHYHAVTINLQNRLESNLSLDSTELIEESYIIASHFDFEIEMSCFTASQIAVFTEMLMSQNLDMDLVLGHPALNVNSNILHFSSNATLDYTTHTYLAFDSRTLGITGSVATMFLMRDRYLNDEEFFDLSIKSFEDLTIENLLEVEI